MSDTAEFKYAIKKPSGYYSEMFGKLNSPEQHGVVVAALEGYLPNDTDLLIAAPDLLAALKAYVQADDLTGDPETCIGEYDKEMEAAYKLALSAISKAEGRA